MRDYCKVHREVVELCSAYPRAQRDKLIAWYVVYFMTGVEEPLPKAIQPIAQSLKVRADIIAQKSAAGRVGGVKKSQKTSEKPVKSWKKTVGFSEEKDEKTYTVPPSIPAETPDSATSTPVSVPGEIEIKNKSKGSAVGGHTPAPAPGEVVMFHGKAYEMTSNSTMREVSR